MLGGRPHRTARPVRWTGTSAASCQHLAQRLRSVSTLWALSIVGLARQVRRHVCAQPKAARLWRQPAKVPEPIGFCCRIRPWLEVFQPTCVSYFTNSRLSSCCKNSTTEMGGLESNTGGRASCGGGEAKHFMGWLDLRPKGTGSCPTFHTGQMFVTLGRLFDLLVSPPESSSPHLGVSGEHPVALL